MAAVQAAWGRGFWQQDMQQQCYQGNHLTAVRLPGSPPEAEASRLCPCRDAHAAVPCTLL